VKGYAPILLAVALLATVPLISSSNVVLNFLVMALLIALAGQGWNLLGGYGGQYSFGHAAFFGTGAYVTAIIQMRYGVNAWLGFVVGIAAGALVGAVIGALSFRSGLKGSYFALVTLAFAEVLRIVASVTPITGAGVGTLIKLDLRPEAFQFQSRAPFYWIVLGMVGISLILARMIERSRFGAWPSPRSTWTPRFDFQTHLRVGDQVQAFAWERLRIFRATLRGKPAGRSCHKDQ